MIKMTSAIFCLQNHEATSDSHGNTLNDVYFFIYGCVYEIRYMF